MQWSHHNDKLWRHRGNTARVELDVVLIGRIGCNKHYFGRIWRYKAEYGWERVIHI